MRYEYLPELKVCPFCGERAVLYKTNDGRYYIECDNMNCPMKPATIISSNKDKLIQAWNTRTEEI